MHRRLAASARNRPCSSSMAQRGAQWAGGWLAVAGHSGRWGVTPYGTCLCHCGPLRPPLIENIPRDASWCDFGIARPPAASTKGLPRLAGKPVVDQLNDRFELEIADDHSGGSSNPAGWSVPGVAGDVQKVIYTAASRRVCAVDMAVQQLTLDGTMNGLKTPGGNRPKHKVRCCTCYTDLSPAPSPAARPCLFIAMVA